MRVSALGFVACALLLACGREPTGSEVDPSTVRRIQAISWVAEFPPGYREYRAQASATPGGAGSLVDFAKVRVRMLNADGSVALDTMVAFPPGADEVQMTFPVTLPVTAPASGATLALNLRYVNAAGDTVFSGGPVSITAVPSAPGDPAPPAQTVTIPLSYSGPGATTATRVRITPQTLTLQTGSEFTIGAYATDNDGNVVGGVPILFSSQNVELATINAATGAGVAGNARGTVLIRAQLLTGPADVLTLTIISPPKSLALTSGAGQIGAVGTLLTQPVVVKVTATDGGPAAGVSVTFTPSGDGSVPSATVTTGTDGLAATTWKLGSIVGQQTLTAAVQGLAGSPVTITATGRSVAPVRLAFAKEPSPVVAAGTPLAGAIEVHALDASGEIAKTFEGPVSLTIAGGASLAGATTVSAVAGVATFTGLSTKTPGTYTLAAAAGSLIGATSGSFVVNPGPTTQLTFLGQPNIDATAGQPLEAITVAARDAFGNVAAAFTGPVTLLLSPSSAAIVAAGVTMGELPPAALTAPISATANAVAGIATFDALRVTGGGVWQVSATATGLTPATSGVPIGIHPAAAAGIQLVSGEGQSAQATLALANPVIVKVVDAFGNAVPGAVVSFAPLSGSGSVAPATATSSGNGIAQTVWTLGQAAGAMTLRATVAGLAPSAALSVSATATEPPGSGTATQLVFTAQPTASGAGVAMPNVIVTAKDARGAVATGFTGQVTLNIGNNATEAGFATGAPQATAVAGVATFTGLSLNRPGTGYTLIASGGDLPNATSSAFNVTAGVPVSISVDSGDAQSALPGAALPVALVARVRDAFGNLVSGANVTWTVASGGGTLSGVTNQSDANARVRATFTLGPTSGTNSVTVTGAGMNVATFVATGRSGEATQLVFSTAPSDEQAGTVFNPGVTVTAKDASGNVAIDFTGAVTLTLNTGVAGLLASVAEVPTGPALGGTRTVNAVAGVARFTDLSMTKAAPTYTLTASSGALTATSRAFRVRAAKPKHIRVSDGHGQSNTVGRKLGKKFVVTITDEFENPTPGAAVAWTNLSGNGALEEQTFSADSSGRAQAGLLLGNGAGKHRVSASVDGVDEAPPVFEAIAVAGKAKKLVLTGGPAHGSKHKAGASFPQLKIEARDEFENVDSSFAGLVSLGLALNAGDTAIAGGKSANAVGGVATFGSANLRKAGRGYRLRITGSDVTPDSTGVFDIEAGPPRKLRAEDGHGQSSTVNKKLGKKFLLSSTDEYDNPTPGVTVNWTNVLGNGELSEQSATIDSTGRASAALKLNTKAGKHRVSATVSGAEGTPVVFDADAIADKAKKLVATGGPSGGSKHKAGAHFPALKVEAQDEFGNVDSSFTGNVSLGLASNPADTAVAGGKSANAVGGVANFTNANLRKAGRGYRLRITGSDVSPDSTGVFDIEAGPPRKVRAEDGHGQSSTVAKKLGKRLTLLSTDEYDNPIAGVSVSWTSVLGNGELSEQSAQTDSTGRASAALTLSTKSGKHRVSATVTGAEDAPVLFDADGIADKAKKLVATGGPAHGSKHKAGVTFPQLRVEARDQFDNVDSSFTGSVALGFAANAGDTAVAGNKSTNAVGGIATFSNASLRKAGGGYRLRITGSDLSPDSTGVFDIEAGPPKKLRAEDGHGQSSTVNKKLGKKFVLSSTDEYDNPTPGVTVNWSNVLGNGELSEQSATTDATGRASAALKLNTKAGKHRVSATVSGAEGTPVVFDADAIADKAKKLVATGGPSGGSKHKAGAHFPALKVEAQDEFGNVDSSFTGNVSLGLATNPGDTAVAGGKSANAVGGVANFTNANLRKAAKGYRLRVTGTDLASDSTGLFDIEAGAPKKLRAEDGHGQTSTVAKKLGKKLTLVSTDDYDNPTPGVGVSWSSVLGNGELSEQSAQTDSTGRASAALKLGTKSGKHRISATVTGAEGTPVLFDADAVAEKAKKLVVSGGPSGGSKHKAGASFPQLRIEARDEYDNVDSTFAGLVSLGIAANAGGDSAVAGGKSANAVGGIATISNSNLRKAGNGYRLRVTGTDLASDSTGVFDIEAAAPKKLRAEDGHGQTSTVNKTLGKKLILSSTDEYDNPTPGVSVSWTSVLGNGELSEQSAQTDATGRASAALKLSTKSGKHRISATVAGAEGTPVLFDADAVADKAKKLVVSGGPSGGSKHKAGAHFPALKVEAQDEFGNVDSTFAGFVSLGLATNPGADSAIAGTKGANAAGGIATFSNANLRKTGAGYRIRASAELVDSDSTGSFTVESGPVKHLAADSGAAQSNTVGKGLAKKLVIRATDEYGNAASGETVNWTNFSGTGSLGDQSLTTDENGRARASLTLGTGAGKHQIRASISGFEGNIEFEANAVADNAKKLRVKSGPSPDSSKKAGEAIPVRVEAIDQYGNVDSSYTGAVSLGFATNPGADTAVAGGKVVNATKGIAEFSTSNVRKAGSGYRLRASSAALETDSTASFNVAAAEANVVTVVSGNSQKGQKGKSLSKPFEVSVTDDFGNSTGGIDVEWTVTDEVDDIVSSTTVTTDASGKATVTLTLGQHSGKRHIRAAIKNKPTAIAAEFEAEDEAAPPPALLMTGLR